MLKMEEELGLNIDFDTDSMEFNIQMPEFMVEGDNSKKKRVFEFVSKFWKQEANSDGITNEKDVYEKDANEKDADEKANEYSTFGKPMKLVRRKSLDFFKKHKDKPKDPLFVPQPKNTKHTFKIPSPKRFKTFPHIRSTKSLPDMAIFNLTSGFSSKHGSTSESTLLDSSHTDSHTDCHSSLFDSIDSSRSSIVHLSSPDSPYGQCKSSGVSFKATLKHPQTHSQPYLTTLKPILKNKNQNLHMELESVRKSDMVNLEDFLKQFEQSEQARWNQHHQSIIHQNLQQNTIQQSIIQQNVQQLVMDDYNAYFD